MTPNEMATKNYFLSRLEHIGEEVEYTFNEAERRKRISLEEKKQDRSLELRRLVKRYQDLVMVEKNLETIPVLLGQFRAEAEAILNPTGDLDD